MDNEVNLEGTGEQVSAQLPELQTELIAKLAAFLISTFPAEVEAHPEESPAEIAIRIMSAPQKAVPGPVEESSFMKRWRAKYGG